jgi:hypothetical protein
MAYDERQRNQLRDATAFLMRADLQRKALVLRQENNAAVSAFTGRSLAAQCATALAKERQLAQLQVALDALCADHRARGTCPGHCVRGE